MKIRKVQEWEKDNRLSIEMKKFINVTYLLKFNYLSNKYRYITAFLLHGIIPFVIFWKVS